MSLSSPKKASPYGAPNTPIASAKRNLVPNSSIKDKIEKLDDQKESLDSLDTDAHTVGGALFSPTLKFDDEKEDDAKTDGVEAGKQVTREEATSEEGDDDVFNPYLFIASLPPHKSVRNVSKICLPPALSSTSEFTLVLDLDETLVHCTVDAIENPDLIFPVTFNGTLYQVHVRKRPYLDYFLESVSKTYELVVFTASQSIYANTLLDLIDPERRIRYRLFRESCLCIQGNYLKDLTVLGRDLAKTALVDNSPHAYGYQIDNGIPIESWFDDPNDTELLKLTGFLRRTQGLDDVRSLIREHFKTFQLVDNARKGLPLSLITPPF